MDNKLSGINRGIEHERTRIRLLRHALAIGRVEERLTWELSGAIRSANSLTVVVSVISAALATTVGVGQAEGLASGSVRIPVGIALSNARTALVLSSSRTRSDTFSITTALN